MSELPLIRPGAPGLHQLLPDANTAVAVPIPENATGLVLAFFVGGQMVEGRVGFDQSSTPVTGITGTDHVLGYQMPLTYRYALGTSNLVGEGWRNIRDAYLHVACGEPGAIARGMWLFRADADG